MSPESRNTLERPPFSALASVYDAIMGDIEYGEWAEFLLEFLEQENFHPKNVLDLACGTGNSTAPLKERGLECWGVDASQDMLEVAKVKLPGVQFSRGTFTEFQLERTFDLCTCLFDSLNNILESSDLERTLSNVYAHLEPGGWFVADVNTRLGVRELWDGEPIEGVATTQSGQEVHYHWSHVYDPALELGTVQAFCRLGEKEFLELHTERGYDPSDLEPVLKKVGFSSIHFVEYPDFAAPDEDTPRVWVFARK
jgi:ubiquinone/menaquinone biosynthesis C-methylase UbiE